MSRKNSISKILQAKNWNSEKAAIELYKANKAEFERRDTVWTAARFNAVKLGYDETAWLREVVSKFFGVNENDIPRRDKRTKRARDQRGDSMSISREARKSKKAGK